MLNRSGREREKLPATVGECPDVRAAQTKVRELLRRTEATERSLLEMQRRLYHDADDNIRRDIARAAEAIFAGNDSPAIADPKTEHDRLSLEAAALNQALAKAREVLSDVRERRSRQFRVAAMPEHRRIVRRIARLTALLMQANAEEVGLRRRLVEIAGVTPSDVDLPPMAQPHASPLAWFGTECPAEVWLATARRRGFIRADDDLAALEE